MNGYYSEYDTGEYDTGEFDAEYEDAEYEEYEEAKRPKRPARPPVRTAPRGSTYRPPLPPNVAQGAVTRAEFRSTVNRIGQQISINSNAIKTVDARQRRLGGELNRMSSALRKENTALRNSIQTVAIAPLLFPADSPLAGIGPLLLLGDGLGGGGSGDSSGGLFGSGGGGGTGLLALLALSGALSKDKTTT